jgi:hypothetical protein
MRARRLLQVLFGGFHAPSIDGGASRDEERAADSIEIYYRPGGTGPPRVLSLRADLLYSRAGEPGFLMVKAIDHAASPPGTTLSAGMDTSRRRGD